MEKETLTVTQINTRIDRILKRNPTLKNVCVRGEISNYKSYPRGNSYFTLKDENSQIPVTLYNTYKEFIKFQPEDGMKVIVKGSIGGYIKQGEYRLYAHRMKRDGVGDLYREFLELKDKLEKEGLFDEEHKKPLPKYPKRIGVITAKTGAVIKDIITTIKRRYPICEILLFSTLVQGDHAAPQIISQLKYSQNFDLDLLIIGRGGGSIEDLWPFNEESVAREIFKCKIPVISAVGHQTDYTISDFVADKRAATPTAAAEIAVPNITELQYKVDNLSKRANTTINNKLNHDRNNLNHITEKQIFKDPASIYNIKGMHLDRLISKLESTSEKIVSKNKQRLITLENSTIFKNPQLIYKQKGIKLNTLINKLSYNSKTIITENRHELTRLENSAIFKNPKTMYTDKAMKLDKLLDKLSYNSKTIITENRHELTRLENSPILKNPNEITKSKREVVLRNIGKLEVLNPLNTLKRGYTLAKSNGKVVSSAKDVKSGDELDIEFDDGTVNTKVI